MRSSLAPILFRPRPLVDLDFVNNTYRGGGGTLASLLSCSRASSGYAGNADGSLSSFSSDALRRTNRGLLVEAARTNVALYSQALDNAAWTKGSATISADAVAAPDGTTTADLVYPSSTGAFRGAYQSFSTSGTHALSCYVKPAGFSWVALVKADGSDVAAWFNISTGVVGTVSQGNASIENLGSGWMRIALLLTSPTYFQILLADADNTATATANGTNGVHVWGAQAEAGASASSYIPTTSASVTRAADAITLQPTGIRRATFTLDNNSLQNVAGIDPATQYVTPTTLNRPLIRRLRGYA